jgi:hypothetical protein
LNTTQVLPVDQPVLAKQTRVAPTGLRRLYLGVAVLFALGVMGQVFLAGAGIFVGGAWLDGHRGFGYLLYLVSLLLLILSFVARLSGSVKWLNALLFVLVIFQGFWIHVPGDLGLPLLKALHPVNALAIFGVSLFLIGRVRSAL